MDSRPAIIAVTILTLGAAAGAWADCPIAPVSCPFTGSGSFDPNCTVTFTIDGTDVAYLFRAFSTSVPAHTSLGATVLLNVNGPYFTLTDSAETLLDSDDEPETPNAVVSQFTESTETYDLTIAVPAPATPQTITYQLTTTCNAPPMMTDHAVATLIRSPPPSTPVSRTTSYECADDAAITWTQFGPVTGIHRVVWDAYAPDGSLYGSAGQGIGKPGAFTGTTWAWLSLYLLGFEAGNLPGLWEIDTFLDGQPLVTEHFTLFSCRHPVKIKPTGAIHIAGIPDGR